MTDSFERLEDAVTQQYGSSNRLLHEIHDGDFQLPEKFYSSAAAALPSLQLDNGNQFVAADGPGRIYDNSLNGQNPRQESAALGNAHHTVELIEQGGFQNSDGSLTDAGAQSIRSAIRNAGAFPKLLQSYEDRTREVQNYINNHSDRPITLRFDRDQTNAPTLTGSRPFIEVTIGGQQQRIPFRR